MVTAPAKRELVRWMTERGLPERRGLAVMAMSASSLRYQPRPDRNVELRERILQLAQRYRRYGAGMIHLKLRQAGMAVNHKRVERLYTCEKLQIRKRRRKKVPVADRQPLVRPTTPNEVSSIDFAFDRVATGRVLKCLIIIDDATAAPIQISLDHSISGAYVTRLLDRACSIYGKPKIIRSDNGPEFTSKAMLNWAHRMGITLRLIQPGKPNQNAFVESFIGRFRDECLNDHWFTSLTHARQVIENYRQEFVEERPKKLFGGLTPAQYAKTLTKKDSTLTTGL